MLSKLYTWPRCALQNNIVSLHNGEIPGACMYTVERELQMLLLFSVCNVVHIIIVHEKIDEWQCLLEPLLAVHTAPTRTSSGEGGSAVRLMLATICSTRN